MIKWSDLAACLGTGDEMPFCLEAEGHLIPSAEASREVCPFNHHLQIGRASCRETV